MSSCGISVSMSCRLIRSLIARSMRTEPDAVLVLDQLADRAHAAVAEVVDVVDRAVAVPELDQVAHDLEDVLAAERPLVEGHVELELVVRASAGPRATGRSARD